MQGMSRASTNYVHTQRSRARVGSREFTSHHVAARTFALACVGANLPSMSPLLKRAQGVAFLLTLVFTILAGDSLLIFPLIPLLWLSPYLYSYARIVFFLIYLVGGFVRTGSH